MGGALGECVQVFDGFPVGYGDDCGAGRCGGGGDGDEGGGFADYCGWVGVISGRGYGLGCMLCVWYGGSGEGAGRLGDLRPEVVGSASASAHMDWK